MDLKWACGIQQHRSPTRQRGPCLRRGLRCCRFTHTDLDEKEYEYEEQDSRRHVVLLLIFIVLLILFLIVIFLLILLSVQCLSIMFIRQSEVDGTLAITETFACLPGGAGHPAPGWPGRRTRPGAAGTRGSGVAPVWTKCPASRRCATRTRPASGPPQGCRSQSSQPEPDFLATVSIKRPVFRSTHARLQGVSERS